MSDTIQRARAGGVELAYETFGDRDDPPLLLIMGLGTQMIGWPEDFCVSLAGRGRFVIRFDNRDVGLSTHLDDAPRADIQALMGGDHTTASYSLSEMAGDAAGLLDALGIEAAHVVGASMGGMIAQTLAIEHPQRVLTLTSIMSTTGERGVGAPTQEALTVLLAPPARTREEAIERSVAGSRVIGSPGFDFDEAALRERAALGYDRGHDPAGIGRHLAAIWVSGDRTPMLRELAVPTLVIHGDADPLVQLDGGRATAAAIPDAELAVIAGLGHDLPRGAWPELVERIAAHTAG